MAIFVVIIIYFFFPVFLFMVKPFPTPPVMLYINYLLMREQLSYALNCGCLLFDSHTFLLSFHVCFVFFILSKYGKVVTFVLEHINSVVHLQVFYACLVLFCFFILQVKSHSYDTRNGVQYILP